MNKTDELAKLHCLQSPLFASLTGNDLYLTHQIKTAIEFSLTGSTSTPAPLSCFIKAALQLLREASSLPLSHGFSHIDLRRRNYHPLWVREELIRTLKSLAGHETSLLLITGLRSALCPQGKYWTTRLQKRYAEALEFIDQLAAHWSTQRTTLNIVTL